MPSYGVIGNCCIFSRGATIKVRYKQTELGAAWAIIQPLATTGVFVFLRQILARGSESSAGDDALAIFCGAIVWQLFADGVGRAGESLLAGTQLITKVYFPRILLPLSTILTALVDFAVALGLLVVVVFFCGNWPSWPLVTFPLFLALSVAAALAVGLWLSALAAVYRDFRYVLPFVLRIGLFIWPRGLCDR